MPSGILKYFGLVNRKDSWSYKTNLTEIDRKAGLRRDGRNKSRT